MSDLSLSGAHTNRSFEKLDGTDAMSSHLLQLMSLPPKLALDLANWKIFGVDQWKGLDSIVC